MLFYNKKQYTANFFEPFKMAKKCYIHHVPHEDNVMLI